MVRGLRLAGTESARLNKRRDDEIRKLFSGWYTDRLGEQMVALFQESETLFDSLIQTLPGMTESRVKAVQEALGREFRPPEPALASKAKPEDERTKVRRIVRERAAVLMKADPTIGPARAALIVMQRDPALGERYNRSM